jgi:hypothetical protein
MLSWTVLFSLIAQNKYYLEPLKNAISIELESFIFFGDATINYERNLISGKNNLFLLNIRSGFGKYYVAHLQGTDNGPGCKISLNPLKGNGKSYFETNFGIALGKVIYCNSAFPCPNWRVMPIVNIGYRYQSNIMFKCYIGTLGIGISLGKRF